MWSFLLGGFLAAIPIVVHLLHRQKVTPVAWGAMQFLLETPLKVRRRRRIDNWLLLLVRMGIILVLVALLARPVIPTRQMTTSDPIDVAVVIDHSMTMGLRTRTGTAAPTPGGSDTLFEQAIDMAQHVASMLPPSGTMSIVLAENTPRIVTATPVRMGLIERSSDGTPRGIWADHLRSLRDLPPPMTRADIPQAVAVARELASQGYNTRKLILVLSDDQRTNWQPGNEPAWNLARGVSDVESMAGAIPVFSMRLSPPPGTSSTNVTVRAVTVLPRFIGVHRPAQILATVSNRGDAELPALPLRLEVNGRTVSTRTLGSLSTGESQTVTFDYPFPEAGSHWVRVSADLVDDLPADNAATAAVQVKPRLPVLVVDGQLTGRDFRQAAFLTAAIQPVDPTIDPVALVQLRLVSAAEFAAGTGDGQAVRLADYPIVVLNDVPRLSRADVDRLAVHAQSGNGVWIILGPRTEASFINDVLLKSELAPISAHSIHRAQRAEDVPAGEPRQVVSVDIREPANGALALITQSGVTQRHALADVDLHAWWSVTPAMPDMRTILATSTGEPLVLEAGLGQSGLVVIWTTSVGDLEWTNLPLVPMFVPLVNETLFHLATGQDADQPRSVDVGGELIWTGPASQAIDRVELIPELGLSRPLLPEIRGDRYFVEFRDTSLPGLYEMRFTAPARAGAVAPPVAYYSVNLDRDELDAGVLGTGDLDWFRTGGYLSGLVDEQTLPQALSASRGGMDIWWILVFGLMALLLGEVFLTYRLARRQSGAALREEGLDAVLPRAQASAATGGGS